MKSRQQFWNKVAPKYGKFMLNNEETYDKACEKICEFLKYDSNF